VTLAEIAVLVAVGWLLRLGERSSVVVAALVSVLALVGFYR
jgi:hypothetical protein